MGIFIGLWILILIIANQKTKQAYQVLGNKKEPTR